MSNVKRVFVEKKPEFAVAAKALRHEIRHYLGIRSVSGVRVLIRYDVEDLSDETFEKACRGVFAEPPVDILYKETFPMKEGDHSFSVEYLPGQFDQRADSAEQCVRFIREDEIPVIRTATTYVIEGDITEEELAAFEAWFRSVFDASLICESWSDGFYAKGYMYDTAIHMNSYGMELYTQNLYEDLLPYLGQA